MKFILKIFKTDSSTDRITLLTLILYYIFDEKFLAIWIFAPKWQAVRAMKLKIFGLIFKKHNWLLANYVCNFSQILAWFLMMSNFVWFQKTNSVHIWKLVLYLQNLGIWWTNKTTLWFWKVYFSRYVNTCTFDFILFVNHGHDLSYFSLDCEAIFLWKLQLVKDWVANSQTYFSKPCIYSPWYYVFTGAEVRKLLEGVRWVKNWEFVSEI